MQKRVDGVENGFAFVVLRDFVGAGPVGVRREAAFTNEFKRVQSVGIGWHQGSLKW